MEVKKFKESALKKLKGNYVPIIATLLVFILMGWFCSLVGFLISATWVSPILMLIVSSLIAMGYVKMIVKVSNGKKVKFDDLLSETDSFLKYMGVSVIVGAINGVLTLFAAIAFRALVSVMAYFGDVNVILASVLIFFGLLLTVGIIMTIVYMSISFSQALFILHDDKKLSVTKILSKSYNMMEGYVFEYFTLVFSFIIWIIVGLFSFGILYLWLIPYMMVTMANFYKKLKKEYDETKGDREPEKLFNNNANKDIENVE